MTLILVLVAGMACVGVALVFARALARRSGSPTSTPRAPASPAQPLAIGSFVAPEPNASVGPPPQPAAVEAPRAGRQVAAPGAANGAPADPLPHPLRILIVDDDRIVGRMIARLMRAHEVTTVTSGEAALAALALDERFDVILSDLMMPGMSGVELSAAIAERYPRLSNRIVFVTGGAVTGEATALLERPDVLWVAKPVRYAELASLIRQVVG